MDDAGGVRVLGVSTGGVEVGSSGSIGRQWGREGGPEGDRKRSTEEKDARVVGGRTEWTRRSRGSQGL